MATIAELADALPYPMTVELIGSLPPDMGADVFEALPSPRQLQVLESLGISEQAGLLARVSAQNAAGIVAEFDPATAGTVLEALPPDRRATIVELLRYPRETVGAVMTNELVTVPASVPVRRALELLRTGLRGPDFVYFVYVLDGDGRLAGVVTLRDLLIADPACSIAEVMNPHLETVHALDPAGEAARRVVDTQLLAMPVVGLEGRLVGALTVDQAVRLVAPEAWRRRAPTVFS